MQSKMMMLPEMDGFQVLQKIRAMSTVPVLTARANRYDKVSGLRLGADDYLTKPFDVEEFVARVFSLIRRYTILNQNSSKTRNYYAFKGLTIETDTRIVTVRKEQIYLQPKEFDILCCLAKNQGRILTKKQIYEAV